MQLILVRHGKPEVAKQEPTANPPLGSVGLEQAIHAANALRHEPIEALSPGADGLAALRILIAGAASHLHEGGWLLLEHGYDQGSDVRALFAQHGFEPAITRADLAGRDRCTGARASARSP